MNIVQRLGHRALTGRVLGIAVHQHSGFRMHLVLKGAFGSRSFEQRLPSYQSLEHFCVTLIEGIPEGLCACMLLAGCDYGGRYDLQCTRLEMCLGAKVCPFYMRGSSHSPAHKGNARGTAGVGKPMVRLHRNVLGGHCKILNLQYDIFLIFLLA